MDRVSKMKCGECINDLAKKGIIGSDSEDENPSTTFAQKKRKRRALANVTIMQSEDKLAD